MSHEKHHRIDADAAQARVFSLSEKRGQGGLTESALVEESCYVNPSRRLRPSENFSETRPGARHVMSGGGHAVDDHREAHLDEDDERFANQIMSELSVFCSSNKTSQLLVVSSPRFLGHLRNRVLNGVQKTTCIPLDIAHLSAHEILKHLVRHGHLRA